MKRASELFTDQDKKAVSEAVAKAEQETSGEIVPMVATISGRYDRAEDLVGVCLGLIAVAVAWLVWQDVAPGTGAWQSGPKIALGLIPVLALFLAGFVVGAVLATRFPSLARLLASRTMMREEVRRSARQAFFESRVRGTQGGTGVLIYVSLFERLVWVVGDDAVTEKLDPSAWDEIKDIIVDGMRCGDPAEAFCAAIGRCGRMLAEHFPIAPDDRNELTNELRLID